MPRPVLSRRVACAPNAVLFKPAGIPARELDEVVLPLDEFEALRLADYEGLYQEAAALRMGISRQTFGRIVEGARRKVADALVNGKALRVEGGKTVLKEEGADSMKIAVPTNEGNVDAHFGHCGYYSIYTVQDNRIIAEERMEASAECGCKSGIAGELARSGVRTLVAGNIGEGAVRVLGSFGISVTRGAAGPVRSVAEAFLAGTLKDTGTNCSAHDSHEGAGHEGCGHH
ncbi:MAG TPA: DNA-binding protein [Treponema sp.]|nr:MAG: hypothetical protein A2Y36_03340 [Treponema sp. GWA1_62_8]OHE66629.1 MAG: hypothetical protein A2001_15345 [Treponema sp. GWC1_61_84]OHE75290.1 MAG: hypothetical protein A2413_06240 [Treponema sp. RIFOXYC1_FULL_61_9]HCM28304.1 DNA-binding protein [Treponema sp.]